MSDWSIRELTKLRRTSRLCSASWGLDGLARQVGRSRAEVNLALDALLGRTPAEAADALAAVRPAGMGGGNPLGRIVGRLFR